jgi:L-asparaginase/Glu-tRNA(Gln) amidotransferase subunit D
MKRIFLAFMGIVFAFTAVSAFAEKKTGDTVDEDKGKIVILATGGTIAGAGEFSSKWIDIINGLSIPVIISSRIDDGVITKENLLCSNTVAANNLSPQKAAILLRLALTGDVSRERLEKFFSEY